MWPFLSTKLLSLIIWLLCEHFLTPSVSFGKINLVKKLLIYISQLTPILKKWDYISSSRGTSQSLTLCLSKTACFLDHQSPSSASVHRLITYLAESVLFLKLGNKWKLMFYPWNRTESPGRLVWGWSGHWPYWWRKERLLINRAGPQKKGSFLWKEIKLDPYLTPYTQDSLRIQSQI